MKPNLKNYNKKATQLLGMTSQNLVGKIHYEE
jgi:hypothetical protein